MRVEPLRSLEDIRRMEHVLKYYSSRYYIAFKLATNSALRMSDICTVKVGILRRYYLNLNELKTGKFRRMYINEQLRAIIMEYIEFMDDEDYLLRTITHNNPPSVSSIYRVFHDCGLKLGMPHIGTHTCRKTFAYHYYREHKDLARLMTILNHSNERETLVYIGVTQDELDEVFATTFL
ncbi:tyrosine-type recombinase/integrase [Paenibacillus sp. LMG 31459]|uniref:Tyrosine-type recombinase/integrase n=1 Tax=Paenibacillus phytohabitans TaxID=2654978 RepID=A0ABX1YMH0_9BACL|nr:tyrosine-type recombinase/integrase [Paenibacillus phytohabitans]NOU81534.1 tyrosine-type recombinase/integrase [Paenibacillus phytohabitans]